MAYNKVIKVQKPEGYMFIIFNNSVRTIYKHNVPHYIEKYVNGFREIHCIGKMQIF